MSENIIVPKRTAKSVAEQLSGCPVRVHERHGRCEIQVAWPQDPFSSTGATWFDALKGVRAESERRKASDDLAGKRARQEPVFWLAWGAAFPVLHPVLFFQCASERMVGFPEKCAEGCGAIGSRGHL